jgi:hypothetical protein
MSQNSNAALDTTLGPTLTPALRRLANVIHFVINFANSRNLPLNATLLLKIVFFAEVKALFLGEKLIANVKMVKANYGPVPDGHHAAINWLSSGKKIQVDESLPSGKSYKSLSEPDSSSFNDNQKNILEFTTTFICDNFTAKVISDWTHQNKIWDILDYGDTIPLVSYLPGRQICVKATPEDIAEAKERLKTIDTSGEIELPAGFF